MDVFLGLDIGSSSIKAAMVEATTGKALGVVTEPETEMDIEAVHNGWAEQDPEVWWAYCCSAIVKLKKKLDIEASQIKGVGISYQMHGLVLVDKEGKPLRKSIIWCDSRAVEIGNSAFEAIGPDTCMDHLLNSPGNFTASKLKWVKDNEPEIYAKAHKMMLPGDYIAFKLSGQINTTAGGLSEGMLWDFKNNAPAQILLDHYGIDADLIPDVVPTFAEQSKVSTLGGEESGLPEGIPVAYRAGDQPNNALSLNVFEPGEVAATGGTSGVVYAVTDDLRGREPLRVNNFAHVSYTDAHQRVGKLLNINGAGIQYRWLLNNLDVDSYTGMNALADEVPIGSDGVCIIPFGNGAERMLENRDIGMHLLHVNLNNHGKGHLCRAALEGIAFSFVYGMDIMKKDGIKIAVMRAGNDNLFRSEIFALTIATLIDQPIEIYNTTGAIGAARAVTVHTHGLDRFRSFIEGNDHIMTYQPLKDKAPYEVAYQRWKKALEEVLERK